MDGARGEEDALLCDHEHPVALQPVPEHGRHLVVGVVLYLRRECPVLT